MVAIVTPTGQGTATPTPTTSSVASTANTGSTFPTQSLNGPSAAFAQQIESMAPAQFWADYGITDSTDQPLYTNPGNTAQLGAGAVWLAWYSGLSQADRQSIQDEMVNAGILTDTDANGLNNSTALNAWKQILGQASQSGTEPTALLNSQGGGTQGLENQVSAGLTTAEENAQKPITATLENPTTLAADLSNAINQELGYTPVNIQQLINQFTAQIQGQDVANASAPRTEAQQQVTQDKAEQSALQALGDDGVTAVVNAYQAAVNKVPGGGTNLGPVTGTNATATPAVSGQAGMSAEAVPLNGQGVVPGGQNVQVPNAPSGVLGAIGHNLFHGAMPGLAPGGQPSEQAGGVYGTHAGTTGKIDTSAGTAGTVSSTAGAQHGGLYAMTQTEWHEAQKLYTPAANGKYTQPGLAPPDIQKAAFTALMQSEYDKTGSWATAVQNIASGTPVGTGTAGAAAKALGTSIANEVNTQLANVQNEINNSTVTTKVTTPDATAEAAQAAKDADPVGYYAGNFAGWGSFATKMLYGTPLTEMPSASVQFNGPVGETSTEGSPLGGTAATPAAPSATAPASTAPSAAVTV